MTTTEAPTSEWIYVHQLNPGDAVLDADGEEGLFVVSFEGTTLTLRTEATDAEPIVLYLVDYMDKVQRVVKQAPTYRVSDPAGKRYEGTSFSDAIRVGTALTQKALRRGLPGNAAGVVIETSTDGGKTWEQK